MIEKKIIFRSQGLLLEGLLCVQEGDRAAVVTHPHPLYGGSMHNQVVEALIKVYQEKGCSTLRFNFRGVENSEGEYGQGTGEVEDVRSALRYLHDAGKKDLDLAGYSFGIWVNTQLDNKEPWYQRMVMVSPPVAFMDFSFLLSNPRIQVVITGDNDEIAPADKVRDLIPLWNPHARFEVIERADHFYFGRIDSLKSALSRLLP